MSCARVSMGRPYVGWRDAGFTRRRRMSYRETHARAVRGTRIANEFGCEPTRAMPGNRYAVPVSDHVVCVTDRQAHQGVGGRALVDGDGRDGRRSLGRQPGAIALRPPFTG